MELLLWLSSVVRYFAIAVGVGMATLSAVNFFIFLSDGTLDKNERRLIGVANLLVRVALLLVLLTLLPEIFYYLKTVGLSYLNTISLGEVLVLFLLSLNALLVVAGFVPATMVPVMQIASWYALGSLNILHLSGVTDVPFGLFLLAFTTWFVFVVAAMNGIMAYLRAKQQNLLR